MMSSPTAIALAVATALPCLWDSDTLDTELRGLPEAFDLVIGRWHRHGDAYYEARVLDLADGTQLTLADYDDLAVAYEHLGQRDAAIETMARKAAALESTPNAEHQYRYHANLGTFYAHAGRFDDALVELRTALELNPDAHFGRERFQVELIKYVAAVEASDELWQKQSFLRHAGHKLPFMVGENAIRTDPATGKPYEDWNGKVKIDEAGWEAAYTATAGMLRFGGLEGPELYRSLGELYLSKGHLNLAWYAYGHAIERGHPAADSLQRIRDEIEAHWDEARPNTRTGHVNPTDADYGEKRAEADAWLQRFQTLEAEAIREGADVRSDSVLQDLLRRAEAKPGGWTLPRLALPVLVALIAWFFVRRITGLRSARRS